MPGAGAVGGLIRVDRACEAGGEVLGHEKDADSLLSSGRKRCIQESVFELSFGATKGVIAGMRDIGGGLSICKISSRYA